MDENDKKDEPSTPEVSAAPRRAPEFYAGKTMGNRGKNGKRGGRKSIQHADVVKHANGAIPGVRNKFMRRRIRKALKNVNSAVETARKLPQALMAQAADIATSEGKKGGRWARRLLAKELAIHQPVYAPTKKELRALRTQKRKDERAGKKDAIAKLVDKMTKP